MALTSIADQRTPGRPVEITFAAETGLPSANQEVLLIGHMGSGTATTYQVTSISNSGDLVAATTEANTKFGSGSEMAKMVIAAVAATEGLSTRPQLKAVPLASADTDFGASDVALTNAGKVKAEFLVSPYVATNSTLRDKLKNAASAMSGAQRVENNQFGTVGICFDRAVTDPSTLATPDSQFILAITLRDTGTAGNAPAYSVGEMAAACAARMASNAVPFNPLDDVTIGSVAAPKIASDFYTIGAGLESETALLKGWTPLRVKANGEVAFVRTITSRISASGTGTPLLTSYYDLQDFQVLYFWRKTLFTRFSQPDLKQTKASAQTAKDIKSEMIRLASAFEDQNMFQAVSQLSRQFAVQRSLSDRHRFDVLTPVNVIPGLHVIASNIQATTQFDTISI